MGKKKNAIIVHLIIFFIHYTLFIIRTNHMMPQNMQKPISIKWRPWGIILGLNMSKDDKNLVYTVAKSAGIENILECYIDENDNLNYRIFIEN